MTVILLFSFFLLLPSCEVVIVLVVVLATFGYRSSSQKMVSLFPQSFVCNTGCHALYRIALWLHPLLPAFCVQLVFSSDLMSSTCLLINLGFSKISYAPTCCGGVKKIPPCVFCFFLSMWFDGCVYRVPVAERSGYVHTLSASHGILQGAHKLYM